MVNTLIVIKHHFQLCFRDQSGFLVTVILTWRMGTKDYTDIQHTEADQVLIWCLMLGILTIIASNRIILLMLTVDKNTVTWFWPWKLCLFKQFDRLNTDFAMFTHQWTGICTGSSMFYDYVPVLSFFCQQHCFYFNRQIILCHLVPLIHIQCTIYWYTMYIFVMWYILNQHVALATYYRIIFNLENTFQHTFLSVKYTEKRNNTIVALLMK